MLFDIIGEVPQRDGYAARVVEKLDFPEYMAISWLMVIYNL
jgi:hypothetical protein